MWEKNLSQIVLKNFVAFKNEKTYYSELKARWMEEPGLLKRIMTGNRM